MTVEQEVHPNPVTNSERVNEPKLDATPSTNAMQQQVKAKPVSSAAIAVGVGIGAGLLLSTLFSSERSRRERMARRLGSYLPSGQSLRSSIENILPDVITDRYTS